MGHVHVSNLIPASRQNVFEYLTDVEKLIVDLRPSVDLSFTLNGSATASLNIPKIVAHAEIPVVVKRLGVTARGMIRIERATVPSELAYCQEAGWFRSWRHTIKLDVHGDGHSTLVTDLVDYRLPYGIFGTLADDLFFNRNLSKVLNDRAARIRAYFESVPTSSRAVFETQSGGAPFNSLINEQAVDNLVSR